MAGGFASAVDDMEALQQIMEANRRLMAILRIQDFLKDVRKRREARK